MSGYVTVKLTQLPLNDLRPLQQESQAEGFKFVDWLISDYQSGKNRFDQVGEAMFGVYQGQQLVAIGGLNRDPYAQTGDVGRVRRVYVLVKYRRQGIGKQLVQRVIVEARLNFRLLTLRTMDESASQFYCALGFQMEPPIAGATHHLSLTP